MLVAAQPPSSAPAMPIRQVRMRPCCLLPGIAMLASRPAPSPRTIQAMMPITDSLVSDVRWVAHELVAGALRTARRGRQGPAPGERVRRWLPVLDDAVVSWPVAYTRL